MFHPPPNLQTLQYQIPEINAAITASGNDWLTATRWRTMFQNEAYFLAENSMRIPVNTTGLWKVDADKYKDRNVWEVPSRGTTLRGRDNNGVPYKFNVRRGHGHLVNRARLRRVVVRDRDNYEYCTFVHYRRF